MKIFNILKVVHRIKTLFIILPSPPSNSSSFSLLDFDQPPFSLRLYQPPVEDISVFMTGAILATGAFGYGLCKVEQFKMKD